MARKTINLFIAIKSISSNVECWCIIDWHDKCTQNIDDRIDGERKKWGKKRRKLIRMCTDTQQISASHNIHTTHLTLHLFLSHTLAGVCDVIRCSVLRSTEISNRIILVFGHSHQANLSLLVFFFSLFLSIHFYYSSSLLRWLEVLCAPMFARAISHTHKSMEFVYQFCTAVMFCFFVCSVRCCDVCYGMFRTAEHRLLHYITSRVVLERKYKNVCPYNRLAGWLFFSRSYFSVVVGLSILADICRAFQCSLHSLGVRLPPGEFGIVVPSPGLLIKTCDWVCVCVDWLDHSTNHQSIDKW